MDYSLARACASGVDDALAKTAAAKLKLTQYRPSSRTLERRRHGRTAPSVPINCVTHKGDQDGHLAIGFGRGGHATGRPAW
jgi:hypothetical protein